VLLATATVSVATTTTRTHSAEVNTPRLQVDTAAVSESLYPEAQAGTQLEPWAKDVAQAPSVPKGGGTVVHGRGVHMARVSAPREQLDCAFCGSS
jgi:hypothetical protein